MIHPAQCLENMTQTNHWQSVPLFEIIAIKIVTHKVQNQAGDRKTTMGGLALAQLPQEQLPPWITTLRKTTRRVTPLVAANQDNYPDPPPLRPFPPVRQILCGQSLPFIRQLPLGTITTGKLLSIVSSALPSVTGSRANYSRLVLIIEKIYFEFATRFIV